MKALPVAVLVVALVLGSVGLTALRALSGIGSDDYQALEGAGLARGNVAALFTTHVVWSRYPALPPLAALVSTKVALLTIPPLLVAFLITCHRKLRTFPVRIAVTLAAVAVPLAAGAIALRGNDDLLVAGHWAAVMLLGGLYTLGACALQSVAELRRRPRGPALGVTRPLPSAS